VSGHTQRLRIRQIERRETMRTVTYGGAVSLDGFLAGVNGAIDWLHFSKDVQLVMSDYWKDVDTILMGRQTYEVAAAQGRAAGKKPKKAKRRTGSRTIEGGCVLAY
jgi:dihydrofolate reductase